jgi:hypothetical protein
MEPRLAEELRVRGITLEALKRVGIFPENIHRGTSKIVFVIPDDGAYLLYKDNFDDANRELLYSRFLGVVFGDLIVEEVRITDRTNPLIKLLNPSNDRLITKKTIVKHFALKNEHTNQAKYQPAANSTLDVTEAVLQFTMTSADTLAIKNIVNLDPKAPNIGLIDGRPCLMDTDGYLFYPVPHKYIDYFRDSSKLLGLCNLVGHGLTKEMFKKNLHLYPDLDFERAIELFVGLDRNIKKEIRQHVETVMNSVTVDGNTVDLSPLFENLQFPEEVLKHYAGDDENFVEMLTVMGLVPVEQKEEAKALILKKQQQKKERENKRLMEEVEQERATRRKTGGNAKSKRMKKIKKKTK